MFTRRKWIILGIVLSMMVVGDVSAEEKIVKEKGLIAYWSFDEVKGEIAEDCSGKENHGKIHGAIATGGKVGQALSFDGTDDYVDCGNDSSLGITDAITIEAWVKWNGAEDSNIHRIVEKRNKKYLLGIYGTTNAPLFGINGLGVNKLVISSIALSIGEWHHVVGVYDKNNLQLYINGIQRGSQAQTDSIETSTGNLEISRNYIDLVSKSTIEIDEVKIYNRALSAEEIREHYGEMKEHQIVQAKENSRVSKAEKVSNQSLALLKERTKKVGGRLTPPSAFSIPFEWEIKDFHGRDFWLSFDYAPSSWRKLGIVNGPKEGACYCNSGRAILSPEIVEDIVKRRHPVWAHASCLKHVRNNPEKYKAFLEKAGEYFLGIASANEWQNNLWGRFNKDPNKWLQSINGGRKELQEYVEKCYKEKFFPPGDPQYCIPVTPGCNHHFAYRLGAKFSFPEIGTNCVLTTMQIASLRGAARQFNRGWGTYISAWKGGGYWGYHRRKKASGNGFIYDVLVKYNVISPESVLGSCKGKNHVELYAPTGGASVSTLKRLAYFSYMAGTNTVYFELGTDTYYANYDWKRDLPPLTRVLQDGICILSPAGEMIKEWYEFTKKRQHNRGVPYTPIGLLFDKYNGYNGPYAGTRIWGALPYKKGDYMMRGVADNIAPWEKETVFLQKKGEKAKNLSEVENEWPTIANTPYGDIFDMLTSDASLKTLKNYPVILLVGRVDIDKEVADKLIRYVKNGGTLVINIKQCNFFLPPELLGVELTQKCKEAGESFSLISKELIREGNPFVYDIVNLTSATPLVITTSLNNKDPLITINRYDKGRTILTTPHWMMDNTPASKYSSFYTCSVEMLNLFSHLMKTLSDELLPVKVEGDIQYLVNKGKNSWIVTLLNNKGINKYLHRGVVIKPEKTAVVKLFFHGNVKGIKEWIKELELQPIIGEPETTVGVTVPPGEIKIIEFVL